MITEYAELPDEDQFDIIISAYFLPDHEDNEPIRYIYLTGHGIDLNVRTPVYDNGRIVYKARHYFNSTKDFLKVVVTNIKIELGKPTLTEPEAVYLNDILHFLLSYLYPPVPYTRPDHFDHAGTTT